MPSSRAITLADGRRVSLSAYVNAWRQVAQDVATGNGNRRYANGPTRWWGSDPQGETAERILVAFRAAIHDRINQRVPYALRGIVPQSCLPQSRVQIETRKTSADWQAATRRTAREVNTPRLRVSYVPAEFRGRLAHRIASEDN